MKRFLVNYLSDIAHVMYDSITDDKLNEVMFVGYYEDIIMVLKELLMFDETVPCHIKMTSKDLNGYDKEYCIILDNDMNIWCEPAYITKEKSYLYLFTERLFIADDCNSAILKNIECDKDDIYEVSYDLDDECECGNSCECCCTDKEKDSHEVVTRVATDRDGKLRGFEKSWNTFEDGLHYHSTYSFFSSNEDMLKNMLENFSIKY